MEERLSAGSNYLRKCFLQDVMACTWKLDSAYNMVYTMWYGPALLMLKGFLKIVKCPFHKIKILCTAKIGIEKSFRLMYSNIGLSFRWTLPLRKLCVVRGCWIHMKTTSFHWLVVFSRKKFREIMPNNIFFIDFIKRPLWNFKKAEKC